MQVLERRTLVGITSGGGRPHAAGDLAFARVEHGYPSELLDDVLLRVTLVLSLRSRAEPWKDSNTLSRLLNDDRPEDVADDWRHDVETRQLPALRSFLLS